MKGLCCLCVLSALMLVSIPLYSSGGEDVSQKIMDAFEAFDTEEDTREQEAGPDININYEQVKEYIRKADFYYGEARGTRRYSRSYYTKAIDLYQSVLTVDPQNDYVLYQLGSAFFDSGVNKDQAIPLLEKAVAINPNVAIYWNNLGFMHTGKSNLTRSTECYLKAIALDEFFDLPYKNAGIDFLNMGKIKTAKKYLDEFVIITKRVLEREQVEAILKNIDGYIDQEEEEEKKKKAEESKKSGK
ncbi:MAG: hypothetical protein PHQ23_00260 [Candidatus Wallbacteria bacterium]|nr:hypothetical protein [Candidatus Wallbacteria bacterium]